MLPHDLCHVSVGEGAWIDGPTVSLCAYFSLHEYTLALSLCLPPLLLPLSFVEGRPGLGLGPSVMMFWHGQPLTWAASSPTAAKWVTPSLASLVCVASGSAALQCGSTHLEPSPYFHVYLKFLGVDGLDGGSGARLVGSLSSFLIFYFLRRPCPLLQTKGEKR